MIDIQNEIKRRRTFAIISHPDAGKTTLTEKLLLYGGAILEAGSVKGKKANRHAVSDWMEIEKQRGISVTSSVLQFEYDSYCINILDTPGHQDFSEDTYRTLMAADAAVMVIDAAKGVEAQTRKLFKVCVMRKIPIFTFINKMDRFAKESFALLEHIEQELAIKTYPMNWPIGSGKDFKGIYDRYLHKVLLFHGGDHGQKEVEVSSCSLEDSNLQEVLGNHFYMQLREDIELLDIAGTTFHSDEVLKGVMTPVFFGSALTNFGVENFLSHFLRLTSIPLARNSTIGLIDPMQNKFSAFVFKIQANMNKAHRDRIAFLRICSGRYSKGMEVFHVQGKKKMKLSQPQQFMAQEREIVDEAYAGDVIGVFDPGIFSIGDTIVEGNKKFEFMKIPTFSPEHFASVTQKDTMKRKAFLKGIYQIAQEGAIQIFQEIQTGMEEIIVGGVGVLQFDVLKQRLKSEYQVDIHLQILPYQCVRWIKNQDIDPNELIVNSDTKKVKDLKGNKLLIFLNQWGIKWALDQNKGLELQEFGDYNL